MKHAALLLATLSIAAVANAAPTAQPTYRAEQFTDFVGINGSPIQLHVITDGPFAGAGKTYDPQVFYDLGVRHYRTGLFNDLTRPDHAQQIADAWKQQGVTAMLLIDPHKTETPEKVMGKLRAFTPGSVAELEGPNEVNNKFPPQQLNLRYKGKTDEAAGAAFMDDVYAAVKADSATRGINVVAYTAIFTDYHLARPHQAFDFANMHSYQGYNVPSSSLEPNELNFNNILPGGAVIKPFVPTECGYNVQPDISNGTGGTGSLRAQALNIPMLLAEYFRHGIPRAYLFALDNADGYGLLESDLKTKRPSYNALRSLLGVVQDASWDKTAHRWAGGGFTPRALLYSLDGAPPTVHTLTLQKHTGEYLLLIWNEVRNFDQDAHKEIVNDPVPVTLRFRTPLQASAELLTQNSGGAYDTTRQTISDASLRVAVPSSVMIIRLKRHSGQKAIAISAPTALAGSTTESSVHIAWKTQDRKMDGGYFVYRNGQFLASTADLAFDDRSSWIRPGLGYRYAVQRYDADGNMSPRAEIVVKTPDRRPDLVCASADIPETRPGDRVVFRGVIKNVGDGPTPPDTVCGLTFFVDGKYTSYSTTDGKPMAPGESRILTANGGHDWIAAAGAHLLRVQVDDINRIPDERSKENNNIDRSFTVREAVAPSHGGSLDGAADPSPGQVDLTQDGTLDWVHWGLGGKTGVNRKAAGGHQIGDLTMVGSGYVDATSGFGMSAKWSDGAPTKQVEDTHASLWLNSVGYGYRFTAPADTTPRVLKIYVGGIEGAGCTLTAHLSDDSASDYVSNTFNGNLSNDWSPVPGGFTGMYTIRYRAGSPNQTLEITWKLTSEPNRYLGQARLLAATLASDPERR